MVLDAPDDAFAGFGPEILDRGERDSSLHSAKEDGVRKWMLAASLQARRQPQHRRVIIARRWSHRGEPGPALRQCPGFVDDQRVDLLHDFERLSLLDEHAGERT